MDVLEAIRTRRSIGKVKDEEVPMHVIEQVLEAATWAPNHYRTEPWRFYVMTGDGRQVLGDAYTQVALAKAVAEKGGDLTAEERSAIEEKEQRKAKRSPVIIAVAAYHAADSPAPLTEELAATHAAVQNMLLAAHALGLGAMWRSGDPLYDPAMHRAFALAEEEHLVGFIYIGYPDMNLPEGKRASFQDKTVWLKG